jgi:hypothetical protein
MASKMYIEKSLEYTVKGIEILRDETIQLFQNRNNYLSFGTGAITLLFYSAATSQYNYPFLTYVVLLLAIPLLSCFLIIISLYINVQIVNLCRYLRSREMLLTYLLESIYENDKKTVFNEKKACNIENGKKLTPIQKQIRELLFEDKPSKITSSIHNHDQILRNQIPIYWERYILNPIPDKLKVIDLQSYMITWTFSVIALISYCTALVFRVSVETKCNDKITWEVTTWQCTKKNSDLNFFNDIYFFRNHNFDFFKKYKEYPILKNLTDFFNAQDDKTIIFWITCILGSIYFLFFLIRIMVHRDPVQVLKTWIEKNNIILLIIILLVICISAFFISKNLFVLFIVLIFNIFGEHIVMKVRGLEGKKVTTKEGTGIV